MPAADDLVRAGALDGAGDDPGWLPSHDRRPGGEPRPQQQPRRHATPINPHFKYEPILKVFMLKQQLI